MTGLLLMIIGFALAWIPLVDAVGGLLALIGLIYLWNGRRELGPIHASEVRVGSLLFVVGIVVAIVGAVVLAAATFSFTVSFNSTQPLVTRPPVSLALEAAVGATLTAGAALIAACWVRLPYSLADPASRKLLLVAGGLDVAISAVYSASEVQTLASFGSVFASGTSHGPWPSPLLVGVLLVVPDLLFLVVYRRVRMRLLAGDLPAATAGASLGG